MISMALLARTFKQMTRDLWLQSVSVLSLSVLLAIVGFYLTFSINLNRLLGQLGSGATVMAAIKPEATPEKVKRLLLRVQARPEVAQAVHISRQQALERFKRQLGPNQGLLQGLEENPLPASLEITLRPDAAMPNLRAMLLESRLIDEIATSRPWLRRLQEVRDFMFDAGAAMGLLLFMGVVFLFSNTVRLSVYVRREQLEVMELVGASRGYLRRPFLLEAVLQGFVACALASLLVWGLLSALMAPARPAMGLDLSALMAFRWPEMPLILAALACLAALVGGFWGVGRALKSKGL